MPSEYEIRAEALRAAVRLPLDHEDVLNVAGAFADWLRAGADVDTKWRNGYANLLLDVVPPAKGECSICTREYGHHGPCAEPADPEPQDVGHPSAPDECTCGHSLRVHTLWDGCTSNGCGCVKDPRRCTQCSHVHLLGTHTCGLPTQENGRVRGCECKGAPA